MRVCHKLWKHLANGCLLLVRAFACCPVSSILPTDSMTHQQQPTATNSSRLQVLSVLANADDLSAFGRHYSSVKLLVDFLNAKDLKTADAKEQSAWSQTRLHNLLSEHSLLHRLSAAVAKGMQLMGQEPALDEATNATLHIIFLLCIETDRCLVNARKDAAGIAAASGEWFSQGRRQHRDG